MLSIIVNGQPHKVDQSITVAQLLERLALVGKRIAVEKNGEIVPRSRFDDATINDGDRLEIVIAVGGG